MSEAEPKPEEDVRLKVVFLNGSRPFTNCVECIVEVWVPCPRWLSAEQAEAAARLAGFHGQEVKVTQVESRSNWQVSTVRAFCDSGD